MASLLERMQMRRAGITTAPKKKKEKSRDVIITNRWDKLTYTEKARPTRPIDSLVTDLDLGDEHKGGTRRPFEAAPEMVETMFHTFYKANARLEDPRNLERELYAVNKIAQEMMDNPKLQELQEYTAGDATMTTIAVDAMAEQLKEIIGRCPPPPPPPQPKPPKPPKDEDGEGGDQDDEGGCGGGGQPGEGEGEPEDEGEPGQGGGQPQDQGDNDQDDGDQGEPGQPGGEPQDSDEGDEGDQDDGEGEGEPGDGGDGTGDHNENENLTEGADTDEFDPDSEEAMEQAEAEWREAYDELLDEAGIDRLANKALDAAADDVAELENLRKSIGLEDGEWKSMSPEARLAMAEKLRTPQMKELSDIVGQMKRFALGVKANRVNDVPHEIYDVETGNNILDVLKPQLAYLGNPLTKPEFFRRYADKELLVYKKRGTEEVGKGPIVMCIDKSGSMSYPEHRPPMNWALAVAEALRRFAAEEDRDFYVLFFGNNSDRVRFDFPAGKAPFEKVLTFLGTVANGGTQFDGVLTEALERASKQFDQQGKGKADIVFVTDGQARLDPQWIADFNAERERVGVRVFSVYIGGASDMQRQEGPVGLLSKLSDAVIPVADLKPEEVEHIFKKV